MKIRIKNLRARAVIGVHEWEKNEAQDVMINLTIHYAGEKASKTDRIADTQDYQRLADRVVAEVEKTRFELVERLAAFILEIVMDHPIAQKAEVEIDKPAALRRIADSVSVTDAAER